MSINVFLLTKILEEDWHWSMNADYAGQLAEFILETNYPSTRIIRFRRIIRRLHYKFGAKTSMKQNSSEADSSVSTS